MSRKETPDVLGEILTGATPVALSAPAAASTSPSGPTAAGQPKRKSARSQPRRAAPAQPQPAPAASTAKPERWEYLVVSLQDHRGWRPRFINGQEVRNWAQAPIIHEYVDQLGEDGWDLVAASSGKTMYGSSDQYQLFFKRPKR
jgi:hypothetical protein